MLHSCRKGSAAGTPAAPQRRMRGKSLGLQILAQLSVQGHIDQSGSDQAGAHVSQHLFGLLCILTPGLPGADREQDPIYLRCQ